MSIPCEAGKKFQASGRCTLRARLRDETREWHERVERQLALVSPHLSLSRYKSILAKFFGFYSPWEERAGEVCRRGLEGFLEDRRKVQHLRQDLAHFEVDPDMQPLKPTLP